MFVYRAYCCCLLITELACRYLMLCASTYFVEGLCECCCELAAAACMVHIAAVVLKTFILTCLYPAAPTRFGAVI